MYMGGTCSKHVKLVRDIEITKVAKDHVIIDINGTHSSVFLPDTNQKTQYKTGDRIDVWIDVATGRAVEVRGYGVVGKTRGGRIVWGSIPCKSRERSSFILRVLLSLLMLVFLGILYADVMDPMVVSILLLASCSISILSYKPLTSYLSANVYDEDIITVVT